MKILVVAEYDIYLQNNYIILFIILFNKNVQGKKTYQDDIKIIVVACYTERESPVKPQLNVTPIYKQSVTHSMNECPNQILV